MVKLNGFQTPDGKVFPTKGEAADHYRSLLVKKALIQVCGGDEVKASFLEEREQAIREAFSKGEPFLRTPPF
jgi:hypothetical protein